MQGCCCVNTVLECPPTIGCKQECMTCCISCKLCCALGALPLPCYCCGPTCACNSTLCKVKGTCFCIANQVSCPCGDDTPILCTLCPFLLLYPKVGLCLTLDGAGAKSKKVAPSDDSHLVAGAPPSAEAMER